MMNLEQVFYILKSYRKITEEKLNQLGVDIYYLQELLDRGVLKQVSDNEYTIDDVDSLFMLGRENIDDKKYRVANTIFDCCYSIEPNNFLVNYQLFYRSILQKRPDKIFQYFDVVYEHLKDSVRSKDVNYYLFLLGHLYNLPEKYQQIYTDLEEEDILLDETDGFSMFENTLRKRIYSNSYSKADEIFNDRFSDIEDVTFEDTLERELILKIFVKSRNINKMIARYINDNKIEELKEFLDSEDEKRFLTISNQYLLKVVNQYLTIGETHKLPIVNDGHNDVLSAIDCNDYISALEYANKDEDNIKYANLHMMLKKMSAMLNDIKGMPVLDNKYQVLIDAVKEMRQKPSISSLSVDEMKSIESKIKELYNGRCVFLLEPMNKEKRDKIHSYVSNFKDVISFNIGQDEERRVVLRYKPYISEYVNIWDTVDEARKAYRNHRYQEAAEKYSLLLKLGTPRDVTYGRYGLTLLKLRRKNEALDCLKVATIMSKDKGGKLDYTDIIDNIENDANVIEKKAKIEMDVTDFNDNTELDVSSEIVNDIIGLMQENELSIFDACTKLNLTLEQINYIKLVYARDCYYLGNIKEGDIYLKQVEKSKNKTPEVKKLFKELQLSKKYYSSRLDEENNQLVFKKK